MDAGDRFGSKLRPGARHDDRLRGAAVRSQSIEQELSFIVLVRLALALVVVAALGPGPTLAAVEYEDLDALKSLSLDELLDVEITTVSKHGQSLFRAPAAVTVLEADQIRRSGVRSLPDALRLVPGVQVARIDANKWSISIRGLAGRYAASLLVLVDGRSVYSPEFGGVRWLERLVPVDEIERIEVIRGPGTSVWGTNAITGIINVISRRSSEGERTAFQVGTGQDGVGFGSFHHRGDVGAATYRVFVDYSEVGDGVGTGPLRAADAWDAAQLGARIDWNGDRGDQVTVHLGASEGDYSDSALQASLVPPSTTPRTVPAEFDGQYAVVHWRRELSQGSEVSLRGTVDRASRTDSITKSSNTSVDLDLSHSIELGVRHAVTWGLGARVAEYKEHQSEWFHLASGSSHREWWSGFVQDRLKLTESLDLVLGAKVEHNDYTGFELLPSLRLGWTPDERRTWWAAATRAARTPSRANRDLFIVQSATVEPTSGLPLLVAIRGTSDYDTETADSLETGYRQLIGERLGLEVALFHTRLKDRPEVVPGQIELIDDTVPPYFLAPVDLVNGIDVDLAGAELELRFDASTRLRGRWSYSFVDIDVTRSRADVRAEGDVPRHQSRLWAELDLTPRLRLGGFLHYVDELPVFDIDAHTRFDLSLRIELRNALELFVTGQNLLDSEHLEFGSDFQEIPTLVERGVHLGVRWSRR